jgi:hypothetical protein
MAQSLWVEIRKSQSLNDSLAGRRLRCGGRDQCTIPCLCRPLPLRRGSLQYPRLPTDRALKRRVVEFVEDDQQDTLLIFYYAGHACLNRIEEILPFG